MCLDCTLVCCRCQRPFGASVLYQCMPKLQSLPCRRKLAITRIITPTEAVLIKKSCGNLECPMNVTQQLLTQSRIWFMVHLMDREDIVKHQAQALPENSWMNRTYIRSTESGDKLAHVPPVADCRNPQVAVGPQPPVAGTQANAHLHWAIHCCRMVKNRLPNLSHPNFKPRVSWDDFFEIAKRYVEDGYRPTEVDLSLPIDNRKRAAVTEVEYATLCTQANSQSQITLADIKELLRQFYRGMEAQGLEGGPDPPNPSSAVGGVTMPTPSDSLNVSTPSMHFQAGYAMGNLPQSSSAPASTSQFSEGTTPGSTSLPSAPLSNLFGQEFFPGSSSLLPPVSEQSQMLGFPADRAMAHQQTSTAPTVPNQHSFACHSESNYLPMPAPSGQMQTTQSPFQDNITASGQLYPDASIPPADHSGLQAQQVAGLYGTINQTGVPAHYQYGYDIPQPGASHSEPS